MIDQSTFIQHLKSARKELSRSNFTEAERCYLSLLDSGIEREGLLAELYQVYQRKGSTDAAIRCLKELVEINPKCVDYAVRLASDCESAGLREASIDAYKKALSLNPELPNCLFNMALQLRKLGRLSESAAAYEEALQRGISGRDEVYNNLALVYSDLNQPERAITCFEQSLAINPVYIPALFNRAALEEEWGRKSVARELYQKVLSIDKSYSPALCRLLYLDECKIIDDPLVEQAESMLHESSVPTLEREELWFALGKAFDDCGRYDAAFNSYASANEIGATRFKRYSKKHQEQFVSDVINVFDRHWFSGRVKSSDLSPIFICGMLRSGSSLVEKVLSGHSHITSGGELPYIPDLVQRLGYSYPNCLNEKPAQFFVSESLQYERFILERLGSPKVFTDKRPDNFMHLGLIMSLFPKARIIWSRREIQDNCLSIYFQQLGADMSYSVSLDWIGHFYQQHVRMMEHWKSLFPDSIFEVNYEEFVDLPKEQLERLLEFLGLAWEDSCLDFAGSSGPVRTASIWQVRKPLYRSSVGRYRHYESHLKALIKYI